LPMGDYKAFYCLKCRMNKKHKRVKLSDLSTESELYKRVILAKIVGKELWKCMKCENLIGNRRCLSSRLFQNVVF